MRHPLSGGEDYEKTSVHTSSLHLNFRNTLNLTFQDFGERSYTLYYERTITVTNVNRQLELEVTEPLTRTPKMEEDTSLRFLIDVTDSDAGDILDITWYFDDVVAQEGGSSYIYHADFAAAGDHEVKVVVDDGTDSTEYGWDLIVADIAQEELLGYSYEVGPCFGYNVWCGGSTAGLNRSHEGEKKEGCPEKIHGRNR